MREVEAAEGRVRKYLPETPLQLSPGVSEELGRDVYLKLECFNPIRVFKLRGALNKLQLLGDSKLKRGVVTASSGNHGLAIAYAARIFGVQATICVPENVNPQKLRAIEEQGAKVMKGGRGYDDTFTRAVEHARRTGLTFVHAFDDADVIAGQGTCGLEMARQLPDMDSAVVAIGGGGLISGIAIALKGSLDKVKVFGAETYAIPSMARSLDEGRRVKVDPKPTIADGMQSSSPGVLTFKAVRELVDDIGLVADDEIEEAIYDLLSRGRVLAEPAGASPLAALKRPLKGVRSQKTVLVVSGGNISLELLSKVLTRRGKGRS
jgi:threonine dehydratase